MAFTPGLTVVGLYKRFGEQFFADQFLSTVGGLAAIMSGLGRIFWGNVVDTIGYQKGFTASSILLILSMMAFPFTAGTELGFAIAACSSLFCLGGSIAMYVTTNALTFGSKNAGEIYSVLFSSLALTSVAGAKLTIGLLGSVGWSGIWNILAAMGGVNLGLLYLLKKATSKPAAWEKA